MGGSGGKIALVSATAALVMWRRSHSSFGAVKPVSARLPVSWIRRSSPTRSSISAHSAAVRWSFQSSAGRTTRRPLS